MTFFAGHTSFIKKYAREPVLFYSVLLVNIIVVFSLKFYPSLDGPAHLYNSYILSDLLKGGQSLLSDYYSVNTLVIPNWIGHVILTSLGLIFPAWLSEKMLIALYIFGLACSFRFLIKQLRPDNLNLSILIFPFAYTHLFCIGFYNYSISFVFFFLTLAYWIKNQEKGSLWHYLFLFLLITITYYSAVVTFGFLGLTLGLLILSRWMGKYLKTKALKPAVIGAFKELTILLVLSIPALVMLFLFYRSTHFPPPGEALHSAELFSWLNDGRALIAYAYHSEANYTRLLIHIILIIIAFDLYQRFVKKRSGEVGSWLRSGDILLVPILIALVLFLTVPDDSGARMMSLRYNVLFFLMLIPWVASSDIAKPVSRVLMAMIIVLHLGLLLKHRTVLNESLVPHAQAIHDAANWMDPGSVVLPVRLSDNWLELHFSNYLGTDKPLVILENYETGIGWFPVMWDTKSLPKIVLSKAGEIGSLTWASGTNSQTIKTIDYVFIYGSLEGLNLEKWEELRQVLESDYRSIYTDPSRYISIYERKN